MQPRRLLQGGAHVEGKIWRALSEPAAEAEEGGKPVRSSTGPC